MKRRPALRGPSPFDEGPSMPGKSGYTIPVTLPFSEEEAQQLLEQIGYRRFQREAVKRSTTGNRLASVLCTTSPDGQRLPVEDAMRVEVAQALKKLLIAPAADHEAPMKRRRSLSRSSTKPGDFEGDEFDHDVPRDEEP